MSTITVKNYGPIRGKIKFETGDKLTVIVGDQATGKSTIAKLIHLIETYLYEFLQRYARNNLEFVHPNESEYFINRLTAWGLYPLEDDSLIEYVNTIGTYTIEGKNKYSFIGSEGLKKVYEKAKIELVSTYSLSKHAGRIFIPAERAFFEHIKDNSLYHQTERNGFIKEFLWYRDCVIYQNINNTLNESLNKYLITNPSRVTSNESRIHYFETGEKLIHLIRSIMSCDELIIKGTDAKCLKESAVYIRNEAVLTDIRIAASGQKALEPLLLTLFSIFLENKRYVINIEEPEVHLFPKTQVQLIELIMAIANETNSNVFITTHSPFILKSVNLLVCSGVKEGTHTTNNDVVPLGSRIFENKCYAYLLRKENNNTTCKPIVNEISKLIEVSEIDTISTITDRDLMYLLYK
jgi:AAA15 family ATPase/GTPase